MRELRIRAFLLLAICTAGGCGTQSAGTEIDIGFSNWDVAVDVEADTDSFGHSDSLDMVGLDLTAEVHDAGDSAGLTGPVATSYGVSAGGGVAMSDSYRCLLLVGASPMGQATGSTYRATLGSGGISRHGTDQGAR